MAELIEILNKTTEDRIVMYAYISFFIILAIGYSISSIVKSFRRD